MDCIARRQCCSAAQASHRFRRLAGSGNSEVSDFAAMIVAKLPGQADA
jgi:hypothetical protein